MRLVPLVEARAAFLAKIEPVASGAIATAKAGGLVVADDVTAPGDVPATAIALERGYAIASRATVGASSYLPALAAAMPKLVEAGEALPAHTDAVADLQDVRAIPGGAEIIAPIPPGHRVRIAGGDIAVGGIIAAAGTRLNGPTVAVLRAAGVTEVPVRVPAIVVVAPKGSSAPAALLMDLVARAGAEVGMAYVPESRLVGALPSTASADLALVSGWSGAALQTAAGSLTESGQLVARDFAVSPGAAMACGFIGSQGRSAPVVFLPGRLEETLAAWLLLARPALDRLAGFASARPSAALPLARKIASAPGLLDLALVRREGGLWKPLAAGDISWAAIAAGDAWLAIPAESEGFASGEIVEAEFL